MVFKMKAVPLTITFHHEPIVAVHKLGIFPHCDVEVGFNDPFDDRWPGSNLDKVCT